jgi:heme oxygenase (biliverdin-producing, ferredoxin)
MNNLKELTAKHHKRAEGTLFVRRMLKKEMTDYEYYTFMRNQLSAYRSLETAAETAGIFDGIRQIKRFDNLAKDVSEMEKDTSFTSAPLMTSTIKYAGYIRSIANDHDKLLAHVYVRHMGDLSGGQVIKRFVPGSGEFYNFEGDVDDLKEKLRSKLHDGLADEAKVCFSMVTEFMIELESSLGIMGKTD